MKAALGWLGALWGIGGVVALLSTAIARLAPIALEALDPAHGLEPIHWLAVAGSLAFFGYTEGYKAFQQKFSPRVVARGLSLVDSPTAARLLLAPLFCMGYFGATRRRMIATWSLTAALVLLIRLVGAMPQPWRGIVDLGVVVALAWGVLAILGFALRAVAGEAPRISSDLPEAA